MRRDKWDKNDGPLKLIWFPPDSGNHLLLAWWMCLTGYAFKHLEINELVNRWESSGSIRFNSLWSRESVTFWRGQESLDPPGRIVKSLALDLKPSAEFSTGLFVHWWNGSESCLVMSYSLKSYGLYSPWNSLGQNTGVGSQPFSRRSSWPRNRIRVSCIAGGSLTNWVISSVQFTHSVMSDFLWPHESQHARPPCPSPTPRVHSDVHRVSDAIQPSHPLSSPSPPAPSPSQHQGLFQWINSSHEVAKLLEFQPQLNEHHWRPRTDLL